jgi:hypothetical protein
VLPPQPPSLYFEKEKMNNTAVAAFCVVLLAAGLLGIHVITLDKVSSKEFAAALKQLSDTTSQLATVREDHNFQTQALYRQLKYVKGILAPLQQQRLTIGLQAHLVTNDPPDDGTDRLQTFINNNSEHNEWNLPTFVEKNVDLVSSLSVRDPFGLEVLGQLLQYYTAEMNALWELHYSLLDEHIHVRLFSGEYGTLLPGMPATEHKREVHVATALINDKEFIFPEAEYPDLADVRDSMYRLRRRMAHDIMRFIEQRQ